jgi:cell division transport system ATP-binding protein
LGLFEEIHDTGTTVLFATHDRSLLELRSHRIVVLNDGRAIDVPDGLAVSNDELSVPVEDFTVPMTRVAV